MNIEETCDILHHWVRTLESFEVEDLLDPRSLERIPRNGIYFLFERNEIGHKGQRIVRIGTHTGQNQLRSRLKQHFLKENKDRSIFRKNIGRCFLNQSNDAYLKVWNADLTTLARRNELGDEFNAEYQRSIEKSVTDLICSSFQFAVVEVALKDNRLRLESGLISLVSRCDECGPSKSWLGLFSPKEKISESGLWQVNELCKQPLGMDELNAFTSAGS